MQIDPITALQNLIQEDRGRILAVLIRRLSDFDLAEESLSDAVESALVHWVRSGVPKSPQAWLITTARRKAIDRIRRGQRFAARIPDLTQLMEEDEEAQSAMSPEIPDERLRLIFTCCHPALDQKSRIALTLRTVGGLTTREIARAFLDTEATMGQRLSRAKAKIGAASIPFRVPEETQWDERLQSVLTVIYLIFNEGWTAGPGEDVIRGALCEEAIFLARMMTELAAEQPEIEALLSLLVLTWSRRDARRPDGGSLVGLDDQDRTRWRQDELEEGLAVLEKAIARGAPGPFQCQAAIQALHMRAQKPERTDWAEIVLIYDRLLSFQPTAVVRLNRAVALMEAGKFEQSQAEIDVLADELSGYQPYFAARAEVFLRSGRHEEAAIAFEEAIRLSRSDDEKQWLAARRSRLTIS